jgi:hypothetical protein
LRGHLSAEEHVDFLVKLDGVAFLAEAVALVDQPAAAVL